ncbi:Betaine aldehyde dehydrogenase [Trichoderma lentiforme]|uniref:aldehyde dehydrogenase (NAD(+)) n=1 Tax=Trichoderma lentiforme TaxID=1567552 RepID=A0A9P4XN96_9HYPO|nr:Betaine aldehyde dehydrogenase [Trichoderma lentiforme]
MANLAAAVYEEELWDVPLGSEQDLDDAVEAARRAFPAWSAVELDARKEFINKRANDSHTGLGGSVWSKDVAHAQRIASRLETGSVFVNSFAKPAPEGFWSGRKDSGFGGEWGPQGYFAYCHPQVMHIYK